MISYIGIFQIIFHVLTEEAKSCIGIISNLADKFEDAFTYLGVTDDEKQITSIKMWSDSYKVWEGTKSPVL